MADQRFQGIDWTYSAQWRKTVRKLCEQQRRQRIADLQRQRRAWMATDWQAAPQSWEHEQLMAAPCMRWDSWMQFMSRRYRAAKARELFPGHHPRAL